MGRAFKDETCKMQYVSSEYFTADDLNELYTAIPDDCHGCLVHVDDVTSDELELSAPARAIITLAVEHGIAWLRVTPDMELFDEVPLPTQEVKS